MLSNIVDKIERVRLLALVPVIILPLGMIWLMFNPLDQVYNFPVLFPVLNSAFNAAIPFFVSAIFARTYMRHGVLGSLFLGCGLAMFGLGGFVSSLGFYIRPANSAQFNVAVFNISVLLSSVFFISSTSMVLAGRKTAESLRVRRRPTLTLSYLGVVILFALLYYSAFNGLVPPFFIDGQGSTPIRDIILLTSVILLSVSSAMLMLAHVGTRASFPYWFSLALALIVVSLCGLLFITTFNGPLNWLARVSLYMSGLYLLAAAFAAQREAEGSRLSVLEGFKALFTAETELRQAKEEAERRAAEAEEGKNILDAIMEHIPEGVTLTGGPPDFRLRLVSRYGLEMSGRPRDELLDLTSGEHQSAWEIYLPGGETLPKREEMPLYRASRRGEVVKHMELVMKRPDGSLVPVTVSAAPVRDKSGAIVGAINAWRDISEIKQAEEALRQAKEEAERASRAKSDFLASMSHEIRTPMNGVLGMTELALMTCAEPGARDYLRLANESGKALLAIINDILDLAKIEAGKIDLEKRPLSLREVVESTLRPLSVTARGKGLDLAYAIDPATPDALLGDAGRIRQVLTNIVGNAIKFTAHGGIRVAVAPAVERSPSPDRERVAFEVADTGIGIPRDKLGHVFENFTQAVSSAHATYGGTGLGLAISRDLVEMMGGRIWVESEEGRGSVFGFTAEFDRNGEMRPPEPAEERASAPPAPPSLKILLAEDDRINQILALELLGRRGHAVTAVNNGKEALEALRREDFDLVLMDVRMPEMAGEEAIGRIRSGEARNPSIPVIALTAHALKGDRERFLAAGMDDYLAKPIDMREFDRTLERVLAKGARGKTVATADA